MADGLPLSPLEIIAAVNRAEGRDSGPLTAGYVDEDGRSIVPQWNPALGLARETLSVPPQVRTQPVRKPDPALQQWSASEPQPPRNVALVEMGDIGLPPEYIRLDTGVGWWKESAFALNERELAQAKRIIVGAMSRALRERERELRAEVRQTRKPRRKRGQVVGQEGQSEGGAGQGGSC